MNKKQNEMLRNLAGVFFISGFSALIYQIAWQRMLFTSFGVDLTSITIIISIFMAGLGVGAFFGGRIADNLPTKTLHVFCVVEAAICLYGLASVTIIHGINYISTNLSEFWVMAIIFAALLPPTFLMGVTLPLLTAFFNQRIKNIGHSIGTLYFANTLGAACGAFSTGFLFFAMFGIQKTILIACALNFFISALVFIKYGINQK